MPEHLDGMVETAWEWNVPDAGLMSSFIRSMYALNPCVKYLALDNPYNKSTDLAIVICAGFLQVGVSAV